MLQIIINLDHVDVLYLLSFRYSYGHVKARQLFIEGLYNLIEKKKKLIENTVVRPTRPSCVTTVVIFTCDGIPYTIFSYKTEVWLLGTEIVKLGIIYCST